MHGTMNVKSRCVLSPTTNLFYLQGGPKLVYSNLYTIHCIPTFGPPCILNYFNSRFKIHGKYET
jgi:hypothetical protein